MMSGGRAAKTQLVFVLKGGESSDSEIVSQAFGHESFDKGSWREVTTEDVAKAALSWASSKAVSSKGLGSPRCVRARAARLGASR